MLDLVTTLATLCFAFAAGIFTVLSLVEKPVWSLMRDPSSLRATDADVRAIHAQLGRLIRLLPPTMKTAMASAGVLITTQAWLRGFDGPSLAIVAVFATCMLYLLFHLEARIRAVADTRSDGEIERVRSGLGRLASLHHVGLGTAVLMCTLQVSLVLSW